MTKLWSLIPTGLPPVGGSCVGTRRLRSITPRCRARVLPLRSGLSPTAQVQAGFHIMLSSHPHSNPMHSSHAPSIPCLVVVAVLIL